MFSEFQQRKLGYMFAVYDTNKDGYLEEDDFAQVGQRLDNLLNLPYDRDSNWFMGIWQGLAPAAGPDGRVDRAAWFALLDNLWSNPTVFEGTIQAGASFYMSALDSDGDGMLGPAEYRVFMRAMNLDESLVDQLFPQLDTNHDGLISKDEYSQRVREFYSDDPAAPGNWLLGPVPDQAGA